MKLSFDTEIYPYLSKRISNTTAWICYAATVVFSAAVFTLINILNPLQFGGAVAVMAALTVFTALGMLPFVLCDRFKSIAAILFGGAAIIGALVLRLFLFDFISGDYVSFLSVWAEFFRENGGLAAFSAGMIGDYNPPYLYILAILSYFQTPDIYLIKLVSVFFDFILAFAAVGIVSHFNSDTGTSIAVFLASLFMPTGWLNGAMWGQCDMIYAAFILWGILLALKNRPCLSMAMLGIAFSFKLQTIFFLPAVFVLLLTKKVRFRHLFVFPGAYVATCIPALMLGCPASEIIGVYFGQVEQYSSYLNLNSPSGYAFLQNYSNAPMWSKMGIALAFAFILAVFVVLFFARSKLNDRVFITVSLLFCIMIPWLLPSMHERYFFIADIFSICFAFIFPRRFYLPLLVQAASYAGYHAYLNGQYIIDLRAASIFMLMAGIFAAKDLYATLCARDEKEPAAE